MIGLLPKNGFNFEPCRLRQKSNFFNQINVIWVVQSLRKKYFCFSEVQISLHDLPSRPERGALAIVTNVGAGSGGRGGAGARG